MADSTDIAAFATAMNGFLATQQTAITDIGTIITNLNAQVTTLQNSAGQIDAADQATLNTIQTTVGTLTAKFAAMDNLTPPVVAGAPPVTPPVTPPAGP